MFKNLLPLFLLATTLSFSTAQAEEFRTVAYVPNWIDLNEYSKKIPYDQLTHICVAFENPRDDEGTMSFNDNNEPLIAEAHKHNVKVLISIGGGSAANDKVLKPRYFHLINAEHRAAFSEKLVAFAKAHNFDGIDVDIEGESINEDYGGFIEVLSDKCHQSNLLLSAALSQGYGGERVPKSAFPKFDFVNIMSYDGTGPWGKDRPGQHSSMEMAKKNVKYFVDQGLPASRAVVGVPFYGYGFGDAFKNHGYSYKEIVKMDPEAHLKDQVGNTIWYNGINTIKAKSQYVVDSKLGGIMIWSLDQDVPGEKSLLSAIHSVLGAKK